MVRLNPIVPTPSPDDVRLTRLEHDIEESGHVCGNCRNPWTSTGRADCPNNRGGNR